MKPSDLFLHAVRTLPEDNAARSAWERRLRNERFDNKKQAYVKKLFHEEIQSPSWCAVCGSSLLSGTDAFIRKEIIQKSFTDQVIRVPHSEYVCEACACMIGAGYQGKGQQRPWSFLGWIDENGQVQAQFPWKPSQFPWYRIPIARPLLAVYTGSPAPSSKKPKTGQKSDEYRTSYKQKHTIIHAQTILDPNWVGFWDGNTGTMCRVPRFLQEQVAAYVDMLRHRESVDVRAEIGNVYRLFQSFEEMIGVHKASLVSLTINGLYGEFSPEYEEAEDESVVAEANDANNVAV